MRTNYIEYFDITEHGLKNINVIFILGGWKFKAVAYRPLLHDLVKRGFRCILYIPKTELVAIGTPYSEIVAASQCVIEDIRQRIKYEKQHGVISFSIFGISLGTIFAMEGMKKCPEVDKLVLLAPFGDFAEHVKLWPKHRYFSKVLASQPTAQKESGEILNQVGPHNNLASLKGRHVLIGYATKDTSTHTKVVERLLTTMRESQIEVAIVKVRGSHLLGIFKNLFISKAYLDFLTYT